MSKTAAQCLALMESRFDEFRHFHGCQANFPLLPRPEFFLEISGTVEYYSPVLPFFGFEGDESHYCYERSDEDWSSSNNDTPPVNNSGTETKIFDKDTGAIDVTGSPFDPAGGATNTTEDDLVGATRTWRQYYYGPPPEGTVTADHNRAWVLTERIRPQDSLAVALDLSGAGDYSAYVFANRYPAAYPRFTDPRPLDEDSAAAMTTQGAVNGMGSSSRARIRFGVRGVTQAQAAALIFKVNAYEVTDSYGTSTWLGVLSGVPIYAHETEVATFVTPSISVPLPAASFGADWDEYDGNPYSGIGLWWIETLSGVIPKPGF